MAYNPTPISVAVERDPEKAFDRLAKLFAREGSRRAVARKLGVAESTVRRWLLKLDEAGLGDPRDVRQAN
jgi:transposase